MDEERTPLPTTLSERVTRLEFHSDHQKMEGKAIKGELSEVARELRAVAESVRALVAYRTFWAKVLVGALSGLVLVGFAFLMRLAYWVQSARMP
jgi:hypothetical protein